jgi:hypothetical protein
MTKKLKTLEQHNADAMAISSSQLRDNPIPNGIACPKCGEELVDSNPSITLTSLPTKKSTHCAKCDYKGYRFA